MTKQSISPKNDKRADKPRSPSRKYDVHISWNLLLLACCVFVLCPFFLGRYTRSMLMSKQSSYSHSFPSIKDAELSENFRHGLHSHLSYGHARNRTADRSRLFASVPLDQETVNIKERVSSESLVIELMKDLLDQNDNVTLSYHCHSVVAQRISCAAIASHGHMVLHTSPDYISLDADGIDLDETRFESITGQPLLSESEPSHREPLSRQLFSGSACLDECVSAFVHPALLVHPKPETVVLIGGSEPSLEQILLHNTVKKVILLDSNLTMQANHSSPSGRVENSILEAEDWFEDPESINADVIFIETPTEDLLDIVEGMKESLDDHGILVVQTQTSNDDEESGKWTWIEELNDNGEGLEMIKEYQQGKKTFLLGFETENSLARWFANEAEVNLAIRERVAAPLKSFDGATMLAYQYPRRSAEDEFCRRNHMDSTCRHGHGLDPSNGMVSLASFEVKASTVPNGGRGVYAKDDIEEGSYIFVDGCVHNLHIPDSSYWIIDNFVEEEYDNAPLAKWKTLMWYTSGYGFVNEDFGPMAHDVDPGIGTFVNHGCNGTANVGGKMYQNLTEYTDLNELFSILKEERSPYNPAFDRTLRINDCTESTALRRIKRGEEIFNNYMTFEYSGELEEYAESLRDECAGRQVGEVSQYELNVQGGQRHFQTGDENISKDMARDIWSHHGVGISTVS